LTWTVPQSSSWLSTTVAIARAILHDRTTRRKWLGCGALLMLGVFALGLWGIDGWLGQSPLRFIIWWLGCAALTIIIMLFALYDALAVIREERSRTR